jgi:hypothetical protein
MRSDAVWFGVLVSTFRRDLSPSLYVLKMQGEITSNLKVEELSSILKMEVSCNPRMEDISPTLKTGEVSSTLKMG